MESIEYKDRSILKKPQLSANQFRRRERKAINHSIVDQIGNTPLIEIKNITRHLNPAVKIFAKAEWFNPAGSIKDRPALSMIREGERSGQLTPDKTIIDATSGNTGIAFAMIGAALGYKVALAIPKNASPERIRILNTYGAELMFTDPLAGTDGAQEYIRKLLEKNPHLREKYFYPDQYNNPANSMAHYQTTGKEIIYQTDGRVTHFVAGLGTTSTVMSITKRLQEYNSNIHITAVQPDSPLHGLEGSNIWAAPSFRAFMTPL